MASAWGDASSWTQTVQFTGGTTNASTYYVFPDAYISKLAPAAAKEESALEWLDRRVDEMRVAL